VPVTAKKIQGIFTLQALASVTSRKSSARRINAVFVLREPD
jgi:hypothetical protein